MFKSALHFLRGFFWFLTGLSLVVFAVNNRAPVFVSFTPLHEGLYVPVWLVLFTGLLLGLLLAAGVTGILRLKSFTRRRQAERKAADMDRQMATLAEDAHRGKADRVHAAASDEVAGTTRETGTLVKGRP